MIKLNHLKSKSLLICPLRWSVQFVRNLWKTVFLSRVVVKASVTSVSNRKKFDGVQATIFLVCNLQTWEIIFFKKLLYNQYHESNDAYFIRLYVWVEIYNIATYYLLALI